MKAKLGKVVRACFPRTVPVLVGFLVLGAAYGILMGVHGYGVGWAVLMSAVCFCGSMQYVALTLLTAAFDPLYAFLLTLMVNARHLFYGVSMLDRYRNTGRWKPLLIGLLCDESFSLLCTGEPPEGVEETDYFLCVSLLNYSYWVLGSLLGGLLGGLITFNTAGLDFVLTALFIVIFLDQWKSRQSHRPALVGVGATVLCLAAFGPEIFLLPAMALILLLIGGAYLREGRHLT